MALALEQEINREGADRREVVSSLERVAKQLQLLDEKLKNSYDCEIWNLILLEEERIKSIEKRIDRIRQYK